MPNPGAKSTATQLGVHFEEVCEMVQTLGGAGMTRDACKQLIFAGDVLSYFQRQFKSGDLAINLEKIDRVALLDALCDQIVTAVGVAHMLGMNIEGALKEVADSNDSKFDDNGEPIFNSQHKVMKGPNHKNPDLAAYI